MKLQLGDKRGLSSLSVVEDWQTWWALWGPEIAKKHGKAGWILFLLDANDRLQEVEMNCSRILRNKPKWNSVGWSQKEWLNCHEVAAEALGWFRTHAEGVMRDCPEWAKFLVVSQEGNFAALERLARELRGIQENGYATVVLESTPDSRVELREVA